MSQSISDKRRKIELANNNLDNQLPIEEIDLRGAQSILQKVLPGAESPFQLRKSDFSAHVWKERLKGAAKYIPNVQSNASSPSPNDSIWKEIEEENASKK
jgi:hypothetical protein